jgi:hypothetical protein
MRKIFLVWILAVMPVVAGAQTDSKTAQFLKKLNLYYYCPSREGLKGFTCDITVTTSAVYKQNLLDMGADQKLVDALDGQKLTLTVTADGKDTIGVSTPTPSGDSHFDAQVMEQGNNFKKNLQSVVDTWVGNVYMPYFDERSFSNSYTVTNGPNGFTVEEKNLKDGSVVDIEFDSNAKLNKCSVSKNGVSLLVMNDIYSNQAKGYQLDAYSGDAPNFNLKEADSFTYGNVAGFTLPLKIVKQAEMPPMFKKGTALTYEFSHYRLGPRPSEGASVGEGI